MRRSGAASHATPAGPAVRRVPADVVASRPGSHRHSRLDQSRPSDGSCYFFFLFDFFLSFFLDFLSFFLSFFFAMDEPPL